MAVEEISINNMEGSTYDALKNSGNVVVSAVGKTYKMPLKEIDIQIESKASKTYVDEMLGNVESLLSAL